MAVTVASPMPRSDIYSLGATLYHLLSGEPPVDAKERFLRPGTLISLRQINPDVSPRMERAIFQALAMHPNERPINAREMRALLLGSKQSLTPVDIPLPKTQKASWAQRHATQPCVDRRCRLAF